MSNTSDILLVDDDITTLHLLRTILESKGFAVTAASGGVMALETLTHNQFKMIITDFNMPGMNGVELAVRVKERHSDMHVFMLTASSMTDVVEAAAHAGISQIFAKPVDLRRLVAAVSSSLQARRLPPAQDAKDAEEVTSGE